MPTHQSQLLYEALKQAKGDVTFYKIAGAGHGGPEFNTAMIRAAVLAFFDKQLKPSPDARSAARPPGGPRGAEFGGPIVLGPDDKPAFDDPPTSYKSAREDIPHGKLEMIEYDSKSVGTRRKLNVYTPPGYAADRKYPVLYLLHGIGGDETEWQRFCTPGVILDGLIADGKAVPMIVVMPNGRLQKNDRPEGTSSPLRPPSRRSNRICCRTSSPRSRPATRWPRTASTAHSRACRWGAGRASISA